MSLHPRRLGKYELQQRLGHGGMAEVWKALDTQLQRHVAIKFLHPDLQSDPSFTTRFQREAQFIASLHHPNIVRIYDFHFSESSELNGPVAYMVMDYIEGQTLAHYLRQTSRSGKFPSPSDLMSLFMPICLAIDYAHQRGMIHRDIKPSNILLDRRDPSKGTLGEPVLSDFGIARLLDRSANTHSGLLLGTPLYTSPEQAMGGAGNEQSDIYALSIILFEACTGTLPFQNTNPSAVIFQQVNAAPPSPKQINPNLPDALSDAILRGLAKDPSQRYTSASELCIAVAEALQQPVQETLIKTASDMAETNHPTIISPSKPWLTPLPNPISNPGLAPYPGYTSSSYNLSTGENSGPSLLANQAMMTPPLTPRLTETELALASQSSSLTEAEKSLSKSPPAIPPVQSPVQPTPPHNRRRNRLLATMLALLALLIASTGVIVLLTTYYRGAPTRSVVGHAYFSNSGQLNQNNSQGINDTLLLELDNLPDPPAGKAYYAWLLGDKTLSELSLNALGRLTPNKNNVKMVYTNPKHTNMLAYESRVLVTLEDASVVPSINTPNKQDWVYYAELSQASIPKDKLHFTMLDHLRHLLSDSPELKRRNLYGGLDMWFLRNTQKVLEWSTAARDDWRKNPDLQHRQFVRILDYIDGSSYVQKDAPAVGNTILSDELGAQVPLLGPVPDEEYAPGDDFADEPPPGYIYLIPGHLSGTVLSPDATQDQRTLSAQIHVAIDQTKVWLEQIHQDAKKLVVMNDDQLKTPEALALLNDLVTNAQYAYIGQVDPLTGTAHGGASWIYNNIQRMANFELKPFADK